MLRVREGDDALMKASIVEDEVKAWMEVCQASILSTVVRVVEAVEEPKARQDIATEEWMAWTDMMKQGTTWLQRNHHQGAEAVPLVHGDRHAGMASPLDEEKKQKLMEQQDHLTEQIRLRQEELASVERLEAAKRQDLEEKTADLEDIEARLEKRNDALKTVENTIQTRSAAEADIVERLKQMEQQLIDATRAEEEKQHQLQELAHQLRTAEVQLAHIDGEVERKHQMVTSLEDQIQNLEGILTDDMPEKKNRAMAAAEAAMTEQQEKLSAVEAALIEKQADMQKLREAFEELDQAFNEKALVQQHELEEVVVSLAKEKSHLEAASAEVDEKKSSLQRLEALIQELENKQAFLDDLLPRKLRSLEEIEHKLVTKQQQLSTMEADMDAKRRELAAQETELVTLTKQVRSCSTARESMERDHQEENELLREQKEELLRIETEIETKKHLINSFEEKLSHLGTQIHAKHELIARQERQEQQFKNYVAEREVAFKEICDDLRNKSKEANEIQHRMDSMTLELSQLENAVMQKRSKLDELQLTHNSFQQIVQTEQERREFLSAECRKLEAERSRLELAIENSQRAVAIQEQLLRSLKENVDLWSNQKKMRVDFDETVGPHHHQQQPSSFRSRRSQGHAKRREEEGEDDENATEGDDTGGRTAEREEMDSDEVPQDEADEEEEEEDQGEGEENRAPYRQPRQRPQPPQQSAALASREPPSGSRVRESTQRQHSGARRRSTPIQFVHDDVNIDHDDLDDDEVEEIIRVVRRPGAKSHLVGQGYPVPGGSGPLYQRILPEPPVNPVTASLMAVQQRAQRLRESSVGGSVNTPRTPRHTGVGRAAGMIHTPSVSRDLYRQYVAHPYRQTATSASNTAGAAAETEAEPSAEVGHSPAPAAPFAVRHDATLMNGALVSGGAPGMSSGPADKLREELRRIRQLTAMQQVATLAQQAGQA